MAIGDGTNLRQFFVQRPCPSCGHCPTCGHAPSRPYKALPFGPWWEYVPATPYFGPAWTISTTSNMYAPDPSRTSSNP